MACSSSQNQWSAYLCGKHETSERWEAYHSASLEYCGANENQLPLQSEKVKFLHKENSVPLSKKRKAEACNLSGSLYHGQDKVQKLAY